MVLRKLHDKRGRVPGEHPGLFQDNARKHNRGNADEISGRGDPPCTAKQRARDQCDNRHLCTAGDKGGGHDGHFPVAVLLDRARRHDARHAAARADQHRDERFTREAEPAEDSVHDKCDTRHIAAVLQCAEHQEQDQHLRDESQHRTNSADDPIHHQAGQDLIRPRADQSGFHRRGHPLPKDGVVGEIGEDAANGRDREVVDQKHHRCEDRKCKNPVGHNPVDPVRGGHAGAVLFDTGVDQPADVGIPLVGDDAFPIIIQCLLTSADSCFQAVLYIGIEPEAFQNLAVPFKQLDRIPPGSLRGDCPRYDPGDLREGLFDLLPKGVLWTGSAVCLRNLYRTFCRLQGAFPLDRRGLDHLAAQHLRELLGVDPVAVFAHNIHHVQRDHHRNPHFGELGGQVKVALNVRSIHQIQDHIRLFLDKIVPGHNLLQGIGRERVDARQVGDDHIPVPFEPPFLFFDGDSRPVSHKLAGACQIVEHGCFAAVGIACKRDFD